MTIDVTRCQGQSACRGHAAIDLDSDSRVWDWCGYCGEAISRRNDKVSWVDIDGLPWCKAQAWTPHRPFLASQDVSIAIWRRIMEGK
jgi:hypothetical protein